MNNRLSQDEIDALLNGTNSQSEDTEQPQGANLSELERDAIGEIGNISFGDSATALSTLLNQKVDITTPSVTVISKSKISDEFPHPYVAIEVNYTEGFDGDEFARRRTKRRGHHRGFDDRRGRPGRRPVTR